MTISRTSVPAPDPIVPSERILVVDDEPQIVVLISRLLRRVGYALDTAGDGETALKMLRATGGEDAPPYALVISDLKMPGADGLTVLGEAKAQSPDTMCILVTGFATLDSAVSALREGAYDFLTKPLDLEHLLSTVRRALEHRALLLQNKALVVSLRQTADALRRRTISLERLHREEQRKTEQLRKVNAIARQITTILDVDTLVSTVVELLGSSFGFVSPSFGLVQGDRLRFSGGALDGVVEPLNESAFWSLTDRGRKPYVRETGLEVPASAPAFDLVFPVHAGQQMIGVWVTNWRPDAPFRLEDLPYLESLAAQTAAVLENARLYALARRADELAFLNMVSRVANQSLDLEETICGVLDCLQQAFHASLVEIDMLDEQGAIESTFGLVGTRAGHGDSLSFPLVSWQDADRAPSCKAEMRTGRSMLGAEFCRRVLAGSPLLCAWTDPSPVIDEPSVGALRSVVGVSLPFGDRPIGVLGIGSERASAFDAEHGHLLQVVGGQVATAIENARLFREVESGRQIVIESRNTLQALFDGILDGIYIVDRQDRILAINRTQAERAGADFRRLVGRPAAEACPSSTQIQSLIAETFAQSVPLSKGERWRGGGGRWTEWQLHTYPILRAGPDRQVDRVVVVLRDVTEQRWLEASLLQSEKLAAVGTLAAGIAHEINNPMTVVSANAQILREEIPPTHPYYGSVQLIDRASERASKIVRNLLDFSRSEEYEFVPTDLNRSILEALSLVETQFRKSGVEVKLELAPGLPHVSASPDHLHVVWLNLLLNARDAIHDARPEGEIQVTTHLYGKWNAVHIADNGAGIPDDQVGRLYEPFFTTKDPGKGTGLGLFTCYRTVTRHGGEIAVDSQEGQGTTFHILLPVLE